MKPGERIYNKSTDKQWSSEVYHKAKEVVEKVLSATKNVIQFDSICEATRRQLPSLCDDTIRDPGNPKWPYWKHLVATAIQSAKKEGKVARAGNGWMWAEAKAPPLPPAEPDKLAAQIKNLVAELVELARTGKEETFRLTHDELVQNVEEMGEMLGKVTEPVPGAPYKHDCVWKDNPYTAPKLVWEVCDRGNLDKDIASLLWAVKHWTANCILVLFEESDFYTAQKKLAQESQIRPLKAEDVFKLHSLLQAGYAQAIRSIFNV